MPIIFRNTCSKIRDVEKNERKCSIMNAVRLAGRIYRWWRGKGGFLSRAFTNARQTRHYVEAIQVEKIQPILNVLDFCSQGTEGK